LMNKLAVAIALASEKFVGVLDKGGKPYILHCLWVMDKVRHLGDLAMICAVLHDIVEDTDITREEIMSKFGLEVAMIVNLLTHKPEDSYEEYIRKVSTHPVARAIKLRDLEHNTKITRLKGLRKKDFERLEKYHKAYTYLRD